MAKSRKGEEKCLIPQYLLSLQLFPFSVASSNLFLLHINISASQYLYKNILSLPSLISSSSLIPVHLFLSWPPTLTPSLSSSTSLFLSLPVSHQAPSSIGLPFASSPFIAVPVFATPRHATPQPQATSAPLPLPLLVYDIPC